MEGWKQGLQRPFILAFFTASSLPASPPSLPFLLLRHFLLLLQGGNSLPAMRQALQSWRKFCSCLDTSQALASAVSTTETRTVGAGESYKALQQICSLGLWGVLTSLFWRPPPPGLGSCPPLLYCRSQLGLLPWTGALGHLGADVGPGLQFCEHVNCLWILQLSGFPPNLLKVFTWPWAWCD